MKDFENDMRTPEEAAARDAVRSLGPVSADPAFRERLGSAFAAGTLQPRLAAVGTKPRRRAWLLWGAMAAAAAVMLAVWTLGGAPSAWKISGVSGDGVASVDGRAVSISDMARSAGTVRAGVRLTTPESGGIQLTRDGMTILLTPGTDIQVPARGKNGPYTGSVRMGQLRITTAPEFAGKRLEIETPETRIHVTGTTLAIIRDPDRTCVCVLEGTVRVRARSGAMRDVSGGQRSTFHPGGDEAEFGEILPMERTKLAMFRDRAPR